MTLSDEDVRKIAGAVSVQIKNNCKCGISDDTAAEMTHFTGMLRDVGDGEIARGVEILRGMINRYIRADRLGMHIGRAVACFIVISMFTGLFFFIRIGIIHFFKK